MLHCGDTVEMPKSGFATPHLWIIVTEPGSTSGEAVIVNVTTLQLHSDKTTVLKPGDHPYIRHESVVLYADARIADVRLIEIGLQNANGLFRPFPKCSEELIERIRQGIGDSPFTPEKIWNFCDAHWKAERNN